MLFTISVEPITTVILGMAVRISAHKLCKPFREPIVGLDGHAVEVRGGFRFGMTIVKHSV